MSKLKKQGGKSLKNWLANPKNREKMYRSDREDAKELSEWVKQENLKEKAITKEENGKDKTEIR